MSMDYLGGFHYQGTALKFFPTAEGYVQATALKVGFAYSYVYNYTDHLGNIRLSYAQDPEKPLLQGNYLLTNCLVTVLRIIIQEEINF